MAFHGWTFEADDAMEAYRSRRQFIKHLRLHASHDSDLGAAELIYGELVGNVVRHASGPIAIVLEWPVMHALLRVRDFGAGFEYNVLMLAPSGHERESGRGLFIVDRLAKSVEVQRNPLGCEVRVTLPVWMP